MQEWTPYRQVHPPHLNGFLVSRQGQFRLTRLPGDRTRLEEVAGRLSLPWYQVRRARIILARVAGERPAQVAQQVHCDVDTVRRTCERCGLPSDTAERTCPVCGTRYPPTTRLGRFVRLMRSRRFLRRRRNQTVSQRHRCHPYQRQQ